MFLTALGTDHRVDAALDDITDCCRQPSAGGAATPSAVPAQKRWRPGAEQLGIQVCAHNANGTSADAIIDSILDYAVARGANSVAFSFPIYTDGQRPTKVHNDRENPQPGALAKMVAAAHSRGLRVTVRPLVDEGNLRIAPRSSVSSAPSWPEQNDEWADGRRYLGLELLQRCRLTLLPTDPTQGDATTTGELSARHSNNDELPSYTTHRDLTSSTASVR